MNPDTPLGGQVVGASKVSSPWSDLQIEIATTDPTRGQLDADERDRQFEETLGQQPPRQLNLFPFTDPNDELLTESRNWLLLAIEGRGALPDSRMEVVWFSDPLILAQAEVADDGTAAFQVAVPERAIEVGGTDHLRIFAQYELEPLVTDRAGALDRGIVLPPELAALVEPGSEVVIRAVGIGVDGVERSVEAALPAEVFNLDVSGPSTMWWWMLAVLGAASLLVLVVRRRWAPSQGTAGSVPL